MNFRLLSIIVLAVFFLTCGKKEDPPQQTQQQQPPQQQTTPPVTQTDAEKKKAEEEKKKADELKKKADEELKKKEAEEKKKKEDLEKKKLEESTVSSIDFAPIFSKRCQKCHGSNLKGKLEGVPDLTRSETQSKSEKQLISTITNGKQAETEDGEDMPSFRNKLSEDEIKAAAKYVLSH